MIRGLRSSPIARMGLLKNTIKTTLAKLGYRISRIQQDVPDDIYHRENGRIVYRAYYRGHCLYCYKGGVITEWVLSGRDFEFQHRECIADAVRRKGGRTVIEAGANIGASLLPLCSDFPELRFEMVEPVPHFFTLLERNKESYGVTNARLHNWALGRRSGERITLHAEVQNAGKGEMEEDVLDSVVVETRTIDELFGDADVSYMKVNVFGSEPDVLLGSRGLIERRRPDVSFEVHPELPDDVAAGLEEAIAMLEGFGYERFSLYSYEGKLVCADVGIREALARSREEPYKADVLARTAD